jgi:hypothetical protein
MGNTSAAILGRVIEPEAPTFTPETARSILAWTFRQDDRERVDTLSIKAQEGSLTPEERDELDEYLRVSNLLALLKSKARLSLKTAGVGT